MKHKNFINLQLHAGVPAPGFVTINFDNNITKVTATFESAALLVWTTSGSEHSGSVVDSTGYIFTVTLNSGYILDTVSFVPGHDAGGELSGQSDTQFTLTAQSGGINGIVTLTSKLATATKSYDLSTSSKWASLADGEHQVTIVAKADGYKDSNASSAVTVTKSSGETLEVGIYKFVDNPSVPTNKITQSLDFVSNNETRTQIEITKNLDATGDEYTTYITYSGGEKPPVQVRVGGGWTGSEYKTIILSTAQQVYPEFYKWAITGGNLVKQESSSETWVLDKVSSSTISNKSFTVAFTSNGTTFSQLVASRLEESLKYDSTLAWSTGTWQNTAYRTITFATSPTGDLLTWLQANGTKQGETTHNLTITSGSNLTVKVNGTTVTDSYTLTGNATITVTSSVGRVSINGTNYTSDQTVSISDADISIDGSFVGDPGDITVTINYAI